MVQQNTELFEKIRQQFDSAPYPNVPLEWHPTKDYDLLLKHNLVTPHYLRQQKVIDPAGKIILDAGCGTGSKSLVLAMANPGARIVGVDLSAESTKLAQQRLHYYGFEDAEFHTLSIDEIPSLGLTFDYINCDEVLYLMPDIAQTLAVMKSVLQPDGFIRANLHSSLQRSPYFRAQKLFTLMGLMDANPEEMEIEIVVETMNALRDEVELKAATWKLAQEKGALKETILMNYLFQGDKGYTISELFDALRRAELEFVNMVNWRQWELLDLFKEADDLPIFWAMSLPDIDIEQRLQIFELLQPGHRLLDFWCGHPGKKTEVTPVADWSDADWLNAQVSLHPQLRAPAIRNMAVETIQSHAFLDLSEYLPSLSRVAVKLASPVLANLLPLWDGTQSLQSLLTRMLQISPVDPVTLEPVSAERAFHELKLTLTQLETFLYVLLERSETA